jgi:hypothetical protein
MNLIDVDSHGMFLLCVITHRVLMMALKRGVLGMMFLLALEIGVLVTMRVHSIGHDEVHWQDVATAATVVPAFSESTALES